MKKRRGLTYVEPGAPFFLTKSAAALFSALSGKLRAATRRRNLLGLAGGGLAVALGEPLLEGLSTGLRYGRWGAQLDGMLEDPPPEATPPSVPPPRPVTGGTR